MDPLTGYLILLAVGFMLRGAVQHARDDYKRTRDEVVTAATVKAGRPLAPPVRARALRHHRTGWWASEVGHGLPVTRTGLHTGWLAHRAAAMQTRAQREEARTSHLDATASFASAVKDHRERQQAARASIEAAIAESPVVQDGSAQAVRAAAKDAVVLPFPKRAPYDPSAMDKAWSDRWRIGDRRVPEPGPHGKPRLSDHVRPGDLLCEECGGTDGAICAACGRPGTGDDPVLLDLAAQPIHRSHLAGAHERYTDALARHGRSAGVPHGDCTLCGLPLTGDHNGWHHDACHQVASADDAAHEISDSRPLEDAERDLREQGKCSWQIALPSRAGGGTYCGRDIVDTEDPPAPGEPARRPVIYCPEHQCEADGDEDGAAQERNDRVKDLLRRGQEVSAHSTPTEGAPPMSGDTSYTYCLNAAASAVAASDQDVATARARKQAAFNLADEMVAANVDPAVVSNQMNYAEALAKAEAAMVEAGEYATATSSDMQRYHGGMEEATVNAPGSIASRDFHGE